MTSSNSAGVAECAPTKDELRASRVAARRAVAPDRRAADDEQRAARVLELFAELEAAGRTVRTVACYLSVPPGSARPEPGTLALAEELHECGVRVLVPKLSPTPDGPRHDPDWAWYAGADDLVSGLWSIPEPSGEGLGSTVLGEADVVLCSALAVTTDGQRLGVGGGWFDRALAFARPDAVRVALVDDGDLVDDLPCEPHDRLVHVVLTPTRTIWAPECGPDSAR